MKVLILALLVMFAAAQQNDWHTCALDIVNLQTDVIELGYKIQVSIMQKIIPDAEKIIQECKKLGPSDWDKCVGDFFLYGYQLVLQIKSIQDTIFKQIIPQFKQILIDCSSWQNSNSIPDCVQDAKQIIELGQELYEAAEKQQYIQVVTLIKQMYEVILKAKTDCQLK